MSVCRGCGAEIVWATTVNGKSIPLDVEPEKRVVVEPEYESDGDPQSPFYVLVDYEPRARMVDTFMPHHATCPEVEQFRGGDRLNTPTA